ncbi:uncharacterized protein BJ171DRAFT_505909 [Polychytrium aggregatum]|uniref:uncharacterized protein n=1 Tax=Polychytrium aggregatum TaxID=110093 RepID=UPI0022FE9288|nr:uncharacterized protein BJ171DRAFT_505909 [Polychytrium aggregatum]KAI9204477.1 hypothetical protein BJ171DRAFT_505909 [Polychytrium aggregatum]
MSSAISVPQPRLPGTPLSPSGGCIGCIGCVGYDHAVPSLAAPLPLCKSLHASAQDQQSPAWPAGYPSVCPVLPYPHKRPVIEPKQPSHRVTPSLALTPTSSCHPLSAYPPASLSSHPLARSSAYCFESATSGSATIGYTSQRSASSLASHSSRSAAALSSSKFAKYITAILFHTCQRLPEALQAEPRQSHAHAAPAPSTPHQLQFNSTFQFIHSVLGALAHSIPLTIVLIAIHYIHLTVLQDQRPEPGAESRLFLVALMVSQKMYDDRTIPKKVWARITGLSIGQLSRLEREFCSALDYNLVLKHEPYQHWLNDIRDLARMWESL